MQTRWRCNVGVVTVKSLYYYVLVLVRTVVVVVLVVVVHLYSFSCSVAQRNVVQLSRAVQCSEARCSCSWGVVVVGV